jgi:TIR domain
VTRSSTKPCFIQQLKATEVQMSRFDAFLSYASEDVVVAKQLHSALENRGFMIWFAPNELQLGDQLFGSIEEAMRRSYYGIFLISRAHLDKLWTSHEMETYRRAAVEKKKEVLPILCGIKKDVLDNEQPSLANLVLGDLAKGVTKVVSDIEAVLSQGAPTIGSIPPWVDPSHRFLSGSGEIYVRYKNAADNQATTTIWELLAFPTPNEYPLFLNGRRYTHRHLLWRAAGAYFHNSHLAEQVLQPDAIEYLKQLFHEHLPEYVRDPEIVANSGYPGDHEVVF